MSMPMTMSMSMSTPVSTSQCEKITSALFYGITSIFVILVNKVVLSSYHFPYFNFLATIQFLTTVCIIYILKSLKFIEIPPLTKTIFMDIFPISIMFLGNVLLGLGSTQALNLPMFTVLRRFSIFFTMIGEYILFMKIPSISVNISVG